MIGYVLSILYTVYRVSPFQLASEPGAQYPASGIRYPYLVSRYPASKLLAPNTDIIVSCFHLQTENYKLQTVTPLALFLTLIPLWKS